VLDLDRTTGKPVQVIADQRVMLSRLKRRDQPQVLGPRLLPGSADVVIPVHLVHVPAERLGEGEGVP
jgi:hypothetical protein